MEESLFCGTDKIKPFTCTRYVNKAAAVVFCSSFFSKAKNRCFMLTKETNRVV